MTNAWWYLLIGLLMLSRGLSKTFLQKLPFTPAIIYLAIGFLLGPSVLHLFYFDPIKQSALLESLTEIAVLISLFSAGVKMPVPFRLKKWQLPLRLASLSMVITIALIAAFSYVVLNLPIGAGVLLGAMLASTDPVLATDAQSRYPGDRDQLRFTLTCEAGINDGSAFPFVMLGLGLLGLHDLGAWGWQWLLKDVIWATTAAIVVGISSGVIAGRTVWKLRGQQYKHDVLDDLVGLGLIAIVYGLSLLVSAWGFLAVFSAAVALRHTELKLAQAIGVKPEQLGAGVEQPQIAADAETIPTIVSAEALVFKEHLERLSELMLVLLVGGMLMFDFWNWRTISLAIFIFAIARPVSVFIGSLHTNTPWRIQGTVGWFGVRGIGSIYYLMYAIQHGVPEAMARDLTQLTLIVVALSILVHGISVKPMMNEMEKK
ncbi:MAG TPA: cation:proton antiporter [Methylophilus sp.]|nr:cation:proton antiporter [Methylophilus sp.]